MQWCIQVRDSEQSSCRPDLWRKLLTIIIVDCVRHYEVVWLFLLFEDSHRTIIHLQTVRIKSFNHFSLLDGKPIPLFSPPRKHHYRSEKSKSAKSLLKWWELGKRVRTYVKLTLRCFFSLDDILFVRTRKESCFAPDEEKIDINEYNEVERRQLAVRERW